MPDSVIKPVSMKTYDTDFAGFSKELGGWFERFGFAIVADHGVDQKIIDATLEKAKAFFALPVEVTAMTQHRRQLCLEAALDREVLREHRLLVLKDDIGGRA